MRKKCKEKEAQKKKEEEDRRQKQEENNRKQKEEEKEARKVKGARLSGAEKSFWIGTGRERKKGK